MELNKEFLDAINTLHKKGAFLTAKSGEKLNTMAISWGNVGYEWKRYVFMALVRKSRHTHHIITAGEDFTVSIPLDGALQTELAYCGSHSGRNVDKFAECGLKTVPARTVKTPVIEGGGYTLECKTVLKADVDPARISGIESLYADGDYHTLIFGEITQAYRI